MSLTHRDLVKPARRLSETRLRPVVDRERWYKVITHSHLRGDRLAGSRVGYLYAQGKRIGLAHGLSRSGVRQSAK